MNKREIELMMLRGKITGEDTLLDEVLGAAAFTAILLAVLFI